MLLEPYSQLNNVRNNIDFLETFVGDGWTVASFCRMLPYAGTPVKAKLEQEQRLLGTPFEPDYRFQDPKLDIFYDWMLETFYERNFTNTGLCHILRSLLFEAHLKLSHRDLKNSAQLAYIHHLTAVCNGVAFYTLRCALDHIEAMSIDSLMHDRSYLKELSKNEISQEKKLLSEIVDYYWSNHDTTQPIRAQIQHHEKEWLGGFENSWTLPTGDRRATEASMA